MPVNAPSTYSSHKPLKAKDEDRNNLYIYRFDNDNQFLSEHVLKSELLTVNYQPVVAGNKTLIIGTGAKGSGYRLGSSGQTKLEGIAISILDENNQLSELKTYSKDDFFKKNWLLPEEIKVT